MAKVLNTAFVNRSVCDDLDTKFDHFDRKSDQCGRKSDSCDRKNDQCIRKGELFNPDLPFCSPDDAYKAWRKYLQSKEGCDIPNENAILRIEISPGCYYLEKEEYNRVIFVDCCPTPPNLSVTLIVDTRDSPPPRFTSVNFNNIRFVRIVSLNDIIQPIVVSAVVFDDNSEIIIVDNENEIQCPKIKKTKHHKCDKSSDCCSRHRDKSCSVLPNRKTNPQSPSLPTPFFPQQPPTNFFPQPQAHILSKNYKHPVPKCDKECDQSFGVVPEISPVIGLVNSGLPFSRLVQTQGTDTVVLPRPTISTIIQNVVLFYNESANLIVNFTTDFTAPAILGNFNIVETVVININGSVTLRRNINTLAAALPFRVLNPISSLIETFNTNITLDNFFIDVLVTLNQPVLTPNPFNQSQQQIIETPIHLIKLFASNQINGPIATNIRQPLGLMNIFSSRISVINNLSNSLTVYLTNTVYYTATDLTAINLRLYGIANTRNQVGPIHVIQNGNTPTWNGATIILPTIIERDYTHTPFDGTIFYVDKDQIFNNNNNGNLPQQAMLRGGPERDHRQKNASITITLPQSPLFHGRILKYIRVDCDDCFDVIIKVEGGRFNCDCNGGGDGSIKLKTLERLKIQNVNGNYWILSKHREDRIKHDWEGDDYELSERGLTMAPTNKVGRPLQTESKDKISFYPMKLTKK